MSFSQPMDKQRGSMLDLTEGSTFRNVVLFSMPIIAQGSFQVAYQLINRFWVGHLGTEELAAVSVSFPIIFLMLSTVIGIAVGAGIMIAQYAGARRYDMVNLTSRNFLAVGGIGVAGVSLIMMIFTSPLLKLLGTPSDAYEHARAYLLWTFGTLILMFGYNAGAGIFRGLGDSKTPTNVVMWTTLLNAVLDPILIFGTDPIPGVPVSVTVSRTVEAITGPVPALGVQGAAIATALANLAGTIVIFILFKRLRGYVSLAPQGFRFDWKVINGILRLGIPTSATMIMVSLGSMVLMYLVNKHGTSAVAGFGIGIVLDSLIMMPSQSIGMAMSTIAGQNIGAGKTERILSSLAWAQAVSGAIGVIVAVTLASIPAFITRAFQPEEEEYRAVFPYVLLYVRIVALRYVMMSLFFPLIGTFRGAGDVMASLVISAIGQLIVTIPAAFILSHLMGYPGILWALTSSTFVAFVVASAYYRTGRWMRYAVVQPGSS